MDKVVIPWARLYEEGWRIVGMNHFSIHGQTYLYCAMTLEDKCIVSESIDEFLLFRELENKAGLPPQMED